MEVLRNLFGNAASGIIRLLVAVGILAAVYLFIVRPTLDTTENISHEVNVNVRKSIRGAHLDGLGEVSRTIDQVNRRVKREIKRSFHVSRRHGDARKLIHCIQLAHRDVVEVQRCTAKY